MRVSSFFLPLLALGLTCGCGPKNNANSADETSTTTVPDMRCFQQVVGRDSTLLGLVVLASLVTGFLALRPYEKDRAEGTITGVRTGDVVTADWQRGGGGSPKPTPSR